jgi:hypothetical protein
MLTAAREDWKRFVNTGGFGVEMTFTSPVAFNVNLDNLIMINNNKFMTVDGRSIVLVQSREQTLINSVIIKGLAAKHFTSMSTEGLPINSKSARITIIEKDLTALNYPVRDAREEVNLINHFVDYIDATGKLKHMRIKEQMPDETVGTITCFLGDYGTN